jgi:hypothetical protein
MFDKEGWVDNRCEEIAQTEYDKEFSWLTTNTQERIYNTAVEEYAEYEAARADALYDAEVERRLGL